ncbi:MAG: hypothetical protein K8S99_14090 [Planctomycetes bacterium]|nr:hypothetical protein [Planctomycetota bacterium]
MRKRFPGLHAWSLALCLFAADAGSLLAEDAAPEKPPEAPAYRWITKGGGSWHEGKNWSIASDTFPASTPPGVKSTFTIIGDKDSLTPITLAQDAQTGTGEIHGGRVLLDLKGHTLSMTNGYVLLGVHREYVLNVEFIGGRVVTGPGFVNIGHWAGSHGEVTLRGKEARWSSAGVFTAGSYGNGVLRIAEGAVFTAQKTAPLAVAYYMGATGRVELRGEGSLLDVGRLFVGGGTEKAGGEGSIIIADKAVASVSDRWVVWPSGAVMVEEGGRVDISDAAAVEVRGRLGGSGLIQRVSGKGGAVAAVAIRSESGLQLKLEGTPLRLLHFDYEQTPTAVIRVALPQFKSRTGGGLVVEPVEHTVKIDGGTVEVTFAEKGRYSSGDTFDLITAGRIEMANAPKVVTTGAMAKRWGGKVVVAKITAGPMAGREVLRLVLGGKR